MSVALRIPPFTFARSASQSRRVVRFTLISTPRSASVSAIESNGTRPCDQRLPSKFGVRAALLGEVGRLVDRGVGDVLHDLVDQVVCGLGLVADAHPLDDVGEAHDAEADRAVLLVGVVGLLDAAQRDVDEVVELAHREAGALLDPRVVHDQRAVLGLDQVLRQVDRREVADRDVVDVLRQADLGAQVRQVDRAGVVVQRPVVDRVLPGQPRVAGGLERDEDRLELLARADLLEHPQLAGLGHRDVLLRSAAENAAP